MREPTARVMCPVCFGDGWIDLRDENALLAEHLDDHQLAQIKQTYGWNHPVTRCRTCNGRGYIDPLRARALRREAYSAVEKALQTIDSPKEG